LHFRGTAKLDFAQFCTPADIDPQWIVAKWAWILILESHCRSHLRAGSKLLTIAADNCSGQNKNNMVLRLATYLVEKGYFKEVEILFYVRGHTKNACDREFNLMKLNFHKKNIYTFNTPREEYNLLTVLGLQEGITVINVTADMFKDWDKHLNKLYKRLEGGTILINHVFRVNKALGGTIIATSEDDHCAAFVQDIKKTRYVTAGEREGILRVGIPETLDRPGLNLMKEVDLYKKWRKYVPIDLQDDICPKPSDESLATIAEERREKSRRRRRQNT
jgi:hypothetical protein